MKTKTTAELASRFGAQLTHIRGIHHFTIEQACDAINSKNPDAEQLTPEKLTALEAGTEDTSAWMVFRILYAYGFEIGLFRG